jgi:outer membrane protein OmpA-like peptidoglycan-associated protein
VSNPDWSTNVLINGRRREPVRQRPILTTLVLVIAGLGLCSLAAAAEVQLNAVLFPDRATIDVPLAVTAIGPKTATAEASVYRKDGQAQIEISFKGMQPAVMFAGNITTYSVFAVTRDGVVENLGELGVVEAKGSRKFSTGQKEFALLVSAEPVTGAPQISRLVVFTSGPAKQKTAATTPFKFDRFGNAYYQNLVKPGNPSIADFPPYKPGAEPVEIWKARKLIEMADGMKLAPGTEKTMADAKLTLAQATNTAASSGGSGKVVTDYAARAGALASEAIRTTVRADYQKMLADEEARKAAEKAALAQGLAQTSAQLDTTTKQKAEVEAMLAQVRIEKAQVQKDRDELAGMLAGAMGQVAETRASALGAVMTLPGISFQTNSAVLTKKAEMTLAKLAGVALVFPKVNFLVEGFTDSTGKIEANVKLSTARAKSVYDVLLAQGIPAGRLEFKGRGPESPVASNDKPEGRAQNRRVEITALTPAM